MDGSRNFLTKTFAQKSGGPRRGGAQIDLLATMRRIRRGGAGGKENEGASPERRQPAGSSPSSTTPGKAAAPALTPRGLTLKKELVNATDGRAEMEMEYMNLLSSIESEKRVADELIESRTRERDGLAKNVEELEAVVKNLRGRVNAERDEHQKEVDRLRSDLEEKTSLLDEKDGQLETAREALKTSAKQKDDDSSSSSSISQQEASLMLKQVEGAMSRLDEETQRFHNEMETLRRQRDEARSKAQHEEEATAQAQSCVADLRAQLAGKDDDIEAFKKALAESQESSVSQQEAALLRVQVDDTMQRLDEETIRFQKEKESLRKQRDEAEKKAQKEEAFFAESQSASADLQARIVVKDREIESLKGTLAKSREYSDSLKAEAKELRQQFEKEADRAENLSQELEAIQMARSLTRTSSPTDIEKTLEREKQHAADREEIDRLNAALADRDSRLCEKDAEIESLQASLRDSIEQSEALVEQVRRLRKRRDDASSETSSREGRQDKEAQDLRAHALESDAKIESLERTAAEANARNGELEAEIEDLRAHLDSASSLTSAADEDRLVAERLAADELRMQLEKKREENQRLRRDLEELCESMKDLASARREEMDEVQSQMSRKSSEVSMKDKEIKILKLTLEEENLKHRNELDRYKAKVRALEPGPEQDSSVEDLRRKNSYLRSQLASQTMEADKLRARVQTLLHAGDSSRVIEVLRSRNETLKQEAAKWKRRYDGLENSIKRVSV